VDSHKDMIDFALVRMNGFTLEGSSEGDNRSIFNLIKTLIQSAPGETLADCQAPLCAVLDMKASNPRARFQGSKIVLLQQTINTLFRSGGVAGQLLSRKDFSEYNRDRLLEYLEICRRIFVSKYTPVTTPGAAKAKMADIAEQKPVERLSNGRKQTEQEPETAMERAFRIVQEGNRKR